MNTMEAGLYWIGDLCYVLDDVWLEVCDLTLSDADNPRGKEGIFTLKDGRKFAMFTTAYGDGAYSDKDGYCYYVDSGTLGCILVSSLPNVKVPDDLSEPVEGGHIHKIKHDFIPHVKSLGDENAPWYSRFTLHQVKIGHVCITTCDDITEYEEDQEEED